MEEGQKAAGAEAVYFQTRLTGAANGRAKAQLGSRYARSCGSLIWVADRAPTRTLDLGSEEARLLDLAPVKARFRTGQPGP